MQFSLNIVHGAQLAVYEMNKIMYKRISTIFGFVEIFID